MFSKTCEYAIRAVIGVAEGSRDGQRVTVHSIATGTGMPEAFMAKILQRLSKAGLIDSVKGPGGGFEIAPQDARALKLSSIVDAIDGDQVYRGCALGLPRCDMTNPCPLHDRFMAVREDLRIMLEGTTIAELIDSGWDASRMRSA